MTTFAVYADWLSMLAAQTVQYRETAVRQVNKQNPVTIFFHAD